MNKWLTNLIENKKEFFDYLCVIVGFVCSALTMYRTSNFILSMFSLIILTSFNLCEKACTDNYLERILNFLMKTNKKRIVLVFGGLYIIALLPMIVGCLIGEITFMGIEGFIEKFFSNPLQNCLGATIICSIIIHLSKLNMQETIYSVVRERKSFFDVFLKFSFMASYLNAINYKIDKNLYITNWLNSLHLFIVVFLGMVLLSIFFLRLIDETPINLKATQVYPSWVLLFGGAFLTSCGLPSLVWENTKHEVILLIGNTILALFVIWSLFFIVKRKCTVTEKDYPYSSPVLFTFFAIIYGPINILFGGEDSDKIMQLISVSGIYLCVIILLLYIKIRLTELERV